jgi:PhzF family phenazine biosynthesis protein
MEGEKRITIYTVDAFTDIQFRGNPAAVCLLEDEIEGELMQKIAFEMNLSETAFVKSLEGKPISESRKFSLRWFTPKVEVPLCGHATLATSWILFSDTKLQTDEIEFETLSGTLIAKNEEIGVVLDFPKEEPKSYDPPQQLLDAMGITEYETCELAGRLGYILIHIKDGQEVLRVEPDFERMRDLSLENVIGVIITSKADSQYDFISRFFAPWVGVPEDPVTGSAHTVLTPYWSRVLGKKEMKAYQASARGGELMVREKEDRVELVGSAKIVLKGELFV